VYLQILDVLSLQQFCETEARKAKGIQTENATNNLPVSALAKYRTPLNNVEN